ncbi:translational activator of GCN4 [Tilletia horrida]|uniref:Translational activator of GCN4 n=1 Tax=Tilletia horrida TaxID=155126 RepID=A0AAN6JT53_9BASI|nr:translational activator of GCN4 [Tilletia horrida]KAK0568360.1 translational activator of GCN4 [Tilletia horrida]
MLQKKKQIAGWVASADGASSNPDRHSDSGASDDDDDLLGSNGGRARNSSADGNVVSPIDSALLVSDWDAFLTTHLAPRIFARSPRSRIAFCQRAARDPEFFVRLLFNSGSPSASDVESRIADVQALLRTSMARIEDRNSRASIITLARALIFASSQDQGASAPASQKRVLTSIQALLAEAQRLCGASTAANVGAISTRAALLDWLSLHLTFLIQAVSTEEVFKASREQVFDIEWAKKDPITQSKALVPLLNAIAFVLDSLRSETASPSAATVASSGTGAAPVLTAEVQPSAAAANAVVSFNAADPSSSVSKVKNKRKHVAIVRGALVVLRRQVRLSFRHLPALFATVLPTSGSGIATSSRHATFVGLLLSVALRLRAFSEPNKGLPGGLGRTLVERHRTAALNFYAEHVIAAASSLKGSTISLHIREAYSDYFAASPRDSTLSEAPSTQGLITASDISGILLPAFAKCISKTPEAGLPVLLSFLNALPSRPSLIAEGRAPRDSPWEAQLWASVLPAAKSSSILTRQAAIEVAEALVSRLVDRSGISETTADVDQSAQKAVERFATDILDGPLKATPVTAAATGAKGKAAPKATSSSSGAASQPLATGEVRASMYALLAAIPPQTVGGLSGLSPLISKSLVPCLVKDVAAAAPAGNWLAGPESLIRSCLDALIPHLRAALQSSATAPGTPGALTEGEAKAIGEAVAAALSIAPGANPAKQNAKRALWARVGDVFVAALSTNGKSSSSVIVPQSLALDALAAALLPALEAALKTTHATPLSANPVEGFVSIAIALSLGQGGNKASAISKLWTGTDLLKGKMTDGLLSTGGKTGFFLLNDKIWRKSATVASAAGATTSSTSSSTAAPANVKDAANTAATTRAAALVQEEQDLWLLRALGGLLRSPDAVRELSTKVQGQSAPANPDARSAFGAALLHLTLDSTSMLVRQTSSNVIRSWMTGSADVLQPTLASALRSWVRNREIEAEKERERFSKAAGGKSAIVAEDDPAASAKTKAPRSYSRDLRALLSVIVSRPSQPESHSSPQPATAEVGSDLDPAITAGDTVIPSAANPEKVLSQDLVLLDLLIVSHVSELGPASETGAVFVDLCQSSGVDPHELIVRRKDEALGEVRSYLSAAQEDTAAPVASAGGAVLYTAATRALSTLAFVAPHEIVPTVVKQITTELVQISVLTALTADDIGMWKMPEGTMYNDVLDKKQDQGATASKGGKEKAMEAWEAEVRANIAKKKAAAGTGKPQALTPAQKKEVDAQLKLETQVRLRVEALRENLVEALQSAIALINARSDVLDGHLPELVDFVLRVLQVPQAKDLAGPELQATFGRLLSCASARLSDYKTVAGMALLRIIDESLVPQDFLAEPLKETVLRVLYRIRFLSEQSPLDLATIAFLGPLIHRIIETGGLGVGPEEQDDVFEQMQLSLDFLTFHCEVCDDPRMPRSQFIDDFVQITAKHTQLSKEAVSGLRSLGEAMRSNATIEEQQKLFGHLLSDAVYVRTGCLQALQPLDLTDHDFCAELWVACFDGDDENVRLAEKAWEENGMDVPPSFPEVLVPFLPHANAYVRRSSGKAIAAAAEMHPDQIPELLTQLFALYHEKAKVLKPEYDQFGMVIDGTANQQDPWRARVAVALTIKNLAPHLNPLTDVPAVFDFLVSGQAVGDRSDRVRQRMLDAGSTIIDLHGAECLSRLMAMFESFFNNANSSGDSNDGVLEAVVILFGRLARHLAPTDKRVKSVIDKLLDALKTPSELVQSAVSECLSPLVGSVRDDTPKLVEKLFDDLLHAPKYAERRGAAYGLAGLIKGRGIGSIAEFNVMSKLAEAAEDKKNTNARQGAMFAYETLTASLQRIFEPYIQQILPHLLGCFSDSAKDVQEATQDAAKVIMKTVSGHCVKLILPSLLAGLDEKQWRTKKGAIELLGAMAYCAPRQLSISLPTVIPQLSGVLTDSHTQVRNAANQSLKQFGSVISNPEIKKLVSTLLQALIEPNSKTAPALAAVLSTSFVHYIDSSSLALLVPIIDRGLRERSAQVQKDAARIVGNMAGLTDSKDFVPYLPRLVPLVRIVLVSPVPEARAVAAKALGTLVERLGEGHFIDLIPSLLQVLRSDATSVDRQGSAQGLAEVLAGLGIERMEALLPDIINGASSSRSYVREGYISLLIYLPATFGHRFSPHLGRIIPPILGGIADDSETVRDASMRAGRMIIANYSVKAVDLLLPELEKGLFDGSWRIRMSSIQLAADLLFRLSGISGKNEAEEDAEDGDGEADGEELAPLANNSVQKALIEALGQERRDRILAALFIVRQDPNIPVRQAAIHTWKALVSNTHRTAREILPVMLDMLISSLSAKGADQREIASRTIAELVRKIGEKILRETIPLLRVRGATSTDSAIRAGVCMAVTEILDNATKTQLEDHEDALIAIIRHSLVDEAAEVRSAAAQAFDAAQEQIGPRAIDETIPTLLDALKDPNSAGAGTALAALREVMRARADVVFPVLLPTLTAQPLTAFNANALAALVQVAGPALPRKLSTILTALAKSLEDDQQSAVRPDVDEALATILSSVSDGDTLHQLMIILLGWAGNAGAAQRCITGCNMFAIFCSHKKGSVSISDYMVDWIRKLVALFEAQDDALVGAAWSALEASLKIVSKEEMEQLVVPLRRAVENVGEPGQGLPGFCRPKGVGPLVPVFLAGLMNGTAEQREQGAMGLSDIVERTSAEAIKPFVTTIVGPLIRACGDRHTPPVKTAIITALTTTLRHVAQHCRPFYPQLQRSFQKAVADPISINVRSRAGVALGVLMEHQPRADPVIAELLVGASAQLDSQADPGAGATAASGATASTIDPADLADASVLSLAQVLLHAPPKNIGAASREGVVKLLDNAFQHAADVRESYRKAVGEVCGAMAHMDASTLTSVVNERVLNPGNDIEAQLASLCVVSMLTHAPAQLYGETDADVPSKLLSKLNEWSTLAHGVVRQVREAKALLKTKEPWASDDKLLATLTA